MGPSRQELFRNVLRRRMHQGLNCGLILGFGQLSLQLPKKYYVLASKVTQKQASQYLLQQMFTVNLRCTM